MFEKDFNALRRRTVVVICSDDLFSGFQSNRNDLVILSKFSMQKWKEINCKFHFANTLIIVVWRAQTKETRSLSGPKSYAESLAGSTFTWKIPFMPYKIIGFACIRLWKTKAIKIHPRTRRYSLLRIKRTKRNNEKRKKESLIFIDWSAEHIRCDARRSSREWNSMLFDESLAIRANLFRIVRFIESLKARWKQTIILWRCRIRFVAATVQPPRSSNGKHSFVSTIFLFQFHGFDRSWTWTILFRFDIGQFFRVERDLIRRTEFSYLVDGFLHAATTLQSREKDRE